MHWGEEEKGGRFWINGKVMFPGRCTEFQKKNTASSGLFWAYIAEGTVPSDSWLEDWRLLPKGNGVAGERWVFHKPVPEGSRHGEKVVPLCVLQSWAPIRPLSFSGSPLWFQTPPHISLWRWFIDPKTQGLSMTLNIILNINLSYK